MLPITDSNNLKTKNFNQWLKARNAIESVAEEKRRLHDTSPHNLVEFPALNDVLFKAGVTLKQHRGNAHYREVLETLYLGSGDTNLLVSKQCVIEEVIGDVKQKGGRFLEWSTSSFCWVIMEDTAKLRKKIYNSMSYLDRSLQQPRSFQSNSSSTLMFERQDGRKRKRRADGEEPRCCLQG